MKKRLVLTIAIILMLALTACNRQNSTASMLNKILKTYDDGFKFDMVGGDKYYPVQGKAAKYGTNFDKDLEELIGLPTSDTKSANKAASVSHADDATLFTAVALEFFDSYYAEKAATDIKNNLTDRRWSDKWPESVVITQIDKRLIIAYGTIENVQYFKDKALATYKNMEVLEEFSIIAPYRAPVARVIDLFNSRKKQTSDFIENFFPSFVYSSYMTLMENLTTSDIIGELQKNFYAYFQSGYQSFDEEVGNKWVVYFDIIDEVKLDEEECRELTYGYIEMFDYYLTDIAEKLDGYDYYERNDFGEYLGINIVCVDKVIKEFNNLVNNLKQIEITEAYEYTGKIHIVGPVDTEDIEEMTLRVIKINDEWCIDMLGYLRWLSDFMNDIIS